MLFSKRQYSKPVPKHLPNLSLQGNVVQRYSYEKGVNNPRGRHGIPIPNSAYNTQHDVNRAMLLQTLRKKYFTHAKYRGEIDWDITQAKASEGSWKDEWLTVVFTLPLILLLFGEEERVNNFFLALSNCPEWYQYMLGTIVAASFGFRGAAKFMGKK